MKSDLKAELARRRRAIEKERSQLQPMGSIYDAFARCSPHLAPPRHLHPYCLAWDVMVGKRKEEPGIEIVFHAPPQHGKTTVGCHGFIYAAEHDARHCDGHGRRHAYSTYNEDKAIGVRKEVQQLAFAAGLDPHASKRDLYLSGGTVIRFCGAVSGQLTGHPVDGIHLIDDPIKDRKEASSATIREDRWAWFTDVAQTRRHPGSSVVIMHTRWHPDDLAGRVLQRMKWLYIRLAAICDDVDDPMGRQIGEALWPEQRPAAWLEQFMVNVLTWTSMYQGSPRPLGDTLFQDATYYTSLPKAGGFRVGYGCDLAYTEKTRADWSVLLGARKYGNDIYLTSMLRKQVQADRFTTMMKARIDSEQGPALWFGGTTERGVAQLIRQQIPTFRFALASVDKYVRALPTAEKLWNPGRIFVPKNASWTDEFVHEIGMFTGVQDPQDDQVDALAALGHLFIKGYGSGSGVDQVNKALAASFRPHLRAVA